MKGWMVGLLLAVVAVTAAADGLPVCKMIATGGTIAMRPAGPGGAPVPADSGDTLLAAVPELEAIARMEVETLFSVPSPHMSPARWVALHAAVRSALDREEVAGVIVTHGTDVLEETAFFLDLTVGGDKPVVLTGAMRDASARDFDGPRNLLAAARVCVSPGSRGRGAMLVMHDTIHAAREVRKGHTAQGGFHSGGAGALGAVSADTITFRRRPEWRQHVPLLLDELPRVDIVAMYPGASGDGIEAALAAGAQGIVVQALGLGNVNPAIAAAIESAMEAGIPVVIASRVPEGDVAPVYGYVGGGAALAEAGATFAGDLSPHKARILLMLALQHTEDVEAPRAYFER